MTQPDSSLVTDPLEGRQLPTQDLDADGPAAPPRSNGELVFTEPWQSRMFATTMRLHENGRIEWEQFRMGLIEQISVHERAIETDSDYDYWGCWQRALEGLLDQLAIVGQDELADTSHDLASRPPGHDHDHGDHEHGDHEHGDHEHGHHHH